MAKRHMQPLIIHVEGYRHSEETILALLRYAQALGVTVMLIPRLTNTCLGPAGEAEKPTVSS